MEEIQCKVVGEITGGGYEKMFEQSRRVYGTDGLSPTLHTCGGGNLEPKIMEYIYDEQNKYFRKDGTVGTLTTDGSSPKHNNRVVEVIDDVRVRKLTPRECWRLMGFDDSDFEKAEKVNSNSQLYKQAGNSIVVQVLMAIFAKILN